MSLVKCPECKNRISDAAVSCPKCGYPMAHHLAGNDDLPKFHKKRNGFTHFLLILYFIDIYDILDFFYQK